VSKVSCVGKDISSLTNEEDALESKETMSESTEINSYSLLSRFINIATSSGFIGLGREPFDFSRLLMEKESRLATGSLSTKNEITNKIAGASKADEM
jgi:hypothetical protein